MFSNIDERMQKAGFFLLLIVIESSSGEKSDKKWK
jgi:hypothetical protein